MNYDIEIRNAKNLFLNGDIVKACEILSNILEIDSNNEIARAELNKFLGVANRFDDKNTKAEKFKVVPENLRESLWVMFVEEKYSELLDLLESLIPLCEDDYEFFYLAGACCRRLEKYNDGMDYIKKALSMEPKNYGANLEAGHLFYGAKMFSLAIKTFEFCISSEPNKSDAYFSLASAFKSSARYEEAIELLNNIKDDPDNYFKVMEKIAECHFELADYKTANQIYESILKNNRNGTELWQSLIHSNLINTYMELDRTIDALSSMKKVEELVNANLHDKKLIANPRYNLSHAYLKFGKCKEGFTEYLNRFDRDDFPSPRRKFHVPRATCLDDLRGKTVLIWREQGIGDEMMWYGLIPTLIKNVDAKVIIECEERLVESVQRSFPRAQVRKESFDTKSLHANFQDYDLHVPLSDLMVFFDVDCSKQGLISSWFRPDSEKVEFWNSAIQNNDLTIAFSMRGHLQEPRRKVNYINTDLINKLIENSKQEWICLDYTIHDEHLETLSAQALEKVLIPNINLKDDFDNLGALLSCCDLLISPITAIRALAASVGTPSVTFTQGSRAPYNFGADDLVFSEYEPFMFPNARSVRLPHEMSDDQKNQYLLNFFQDQIKKFSLRP